MDTNGNDYQLDKTKTQGLVNEAGDFFSEHDMGRSPKSSRCSSVAWSDIEQGCSPRLSSKFRGLERRSSVENFGQFGFLVPALALLPHADGADALTQQFGELKGNHRELKLAAAHIDDALMGRGNYGKARSFFKPQYAKRCFDILNNPWFKRLMLANVALHCMLVFFESPSVLPSRVSPAVYLLDFICIILYLFDLMINITFLTWPVFWSRRAEARAWNGVEFVFVCLFICDYTIMVISGLTGKQYPQIFRCLRPAVVLCKAKNIRHIFMVLITIGFKLSKVFSIIFVFVWVFSCTSLYLFMDIYQCRQVINSSIQFNSVQGQNIPCTVTDNEKVYNGTFNHIGLGMLRLFVLLSTENFPEVMLPAMRTHGSFFFFFGFYVFVGVFFLTAILLAIVVDSYWLYSKKHVKSERARERAELAKAWNLLDPLGQGALSIFDDKFAELFRLLKPKNSDAENLMLIEMLDSNEDGEVDSFEWTTMLSQVLSYEFEENDDLLIADDSIQPGCSRWLFRLREGAAYITETITFSRFILVLIIIHCLLFAFKWNGQTEDQVVRLQVVKTIIVAIFLLEGLMRSLVLGKKAFAPLELMDAILVVVAFCTNVAWYFPVSSIIQSRLRNYTTVVSCLAVFCRLPFNNTHLKQAIEVFIRVAPVMADLMYILFIILYLFAAVGMEVFHDFPSSSEGHMYLPECGLGFQTFWCACMILFQMVTTSNWHEIMNSVVESTKTYWSSLYFVFAYILVNMVVMNLFVAITIEAFNKLATKEDDQLPTGIGRQLSDQRPVTAKTFVRKQAVKMLHEVANSIFGSTRAEQVVGRRQCLAASSGTRRRSTTRGASLAETKHNNDALKKNREKEKTEEELNSYKGDKREYKLKKKMRAKKKTKRKLSHIGQKVRVVTTFRANAASDLDLTVGDEVTILKTTDNWWRGECKNRVGWFPASHVVMGTIKAVPEYRKAQMRGGSARPGESRVEQEDANSNVMEVTTQPHGPQEPHSFFRERSSTLDNRPPSSPVRGRIKLKKSGDWRRDIHGEMTVMNAEELRELNNIIRAELRTPNGRPRTRSRNLSVLSRDSRESIRGAFVEDGDYNSQGQPSQLEPIPYSARYHKPASPKGRNSVEPFGGNRPPRNLPHITPKVPAVEFVIPGSPTPLPNSDDKTPDDKKLKVKTPSVVHKIKGRKPEKTNNGEMPEWMKKFVEEKQLTVGADVKLDEVTNCKGARRSSLSTTKMGTGTGTKGNGTKSTGTGTLKTGTGTVKSRSTGSIPGDAESGKKGVPSLSNLRKKSTASIPRKVTEHSPKGTRGLRRESKGY
ncbi:sodium channel protein type 11 subunit alpha isoform X2 [Nematostella vectensis]|uniref:sodium channel protein type 11 subunit alpha isoform X2 n=1 Tax=Nematostella vectensis TaxID=45351 RepID=UPI002076E646|nr:sodium channel protein type 11 subunit alpha isoform X2 [Nematostella vectensis]